MKTKQFMITVEMGDHSRFVHPDAEVVKNLRWAVENVTNQMTVGAMPAVRIDRVQTTEDVLQEIREGK